MATQGPIRSGVGDGLPVPRNTTCVAVVRRAGCARWAGRVAADVTRRRAEKIRIVIVPSRLGLRHSLLRCRILLRRRNEIVAEPHRRLHEPRKCLPAGQVIDGGEPPEIAGRASPGLCTQPLDHGRLPEAQRRVRLECPHVTHHLVPVQEERGAPLDRLDRGRTR